MLHFFLMKGFEAFFFFGSYERIQCYIFSIITKNTHLLDYLTLLGVVFYDKKKKKKKSKENFFSVDLVKYSLKKCQFVGAYLMVRVCVTLHRVEALKPVYLELNNCNGQ